MSRFRTRRSSLNTGEYALKGGHQNTEGPQLVWVEKHLLQRQLDSWWTESTPLDGIIESPGGGSLPGGWRAFFTMPRSSVTCVEFNHLWGNLRSRQFQTTVCTLGRDWQSKARQKAFCRIVASQHGRAHPRPQTSVNVGDIRNTTDIALCNEAVCPESCLSPRNWELERKLERKWGLLDYYNLLLWPIPIPFPHFSFPLHPFSHLVTSFHSPLDVCFISLSE